MRTLKQRLAQIFDDAIRALKDKADACADALRDAAAQLMPAPAVVPVGNRQRARAASSRRRSTR